MPSSRASFGSERRTCDTCQMMVSSSGRFVGSGIAHPLVDSRGTPAYAASAELSAPWKGAIGHLAIKSGTAKSCLRQDGVQTEKAVRISGHGRHLSIFAVGEPLRSCFAAKGGRASLRSRRCSRGTFATVSRDAAETASTPLVGCQAAPSESILFATPDKERECRIAWWVSTAPHPKLHKGVKARLTNVGIARVTCGRPDILTRIVPTRLRPLPSWTPGIARGP